MVARMPLLDLFWAMLWFFLFFMWIWLVISVFIDIFRADMSGWAKAGWIIFVIILPFLGVLIYLVVEGKNMQERSMKRSADQQQAYAEYSGAVSPADELEKLSQLHDSGALTDQEYEAQKAKVINS
jgi:ABC-type multidrug transport system fused ATPase/permease subunit